MTGSPEASDRPDADGPLVPQEDADAESILETVLGSQTLEVFLSKSWVGPLPPPETMAQFDDETQKAIRDEYQTDAVHRRDMERNALEAGIRLAQRGQAIAAAFAFALLICAMVLLLVDRTVEGLMFGGVDFLGVGYSLIRLRRRRRRNA